MNPTTTCRYVLNPASPGIDATYCNKPAPYTMPKGDDGIRTRVYAMLCNHHAGVPEPTIPVGFIEPMLAWGEVTGEIATRFKPSEWVAELKYDGHRMIARVDGETVTAWTRGRIERPLPEAILEGLRSLPDGTYDGELIVDGGKSWSVSDLSLVGKLRYVIFDVLEVGGIPATDRMYDVRRTLLIEAFARTKPGSYVRLAESRVLRSLDEAKEWASNVWKLGGEGLVLKLREGVYRAGYRTRDWVKMKAIHTAVLTVTGFAAGVDGPNGIVNLVGEDGIATAIKTPDNATRAAIDADAASFVGRKIRIEFQERTPAGSYRHPMFDHWEKE